MSGQSPELSVIIVSYNTRDMLRDCLQSVIHTTEDIEIEIIAVDNDSADGSAEMVANEFPEVQLIANNTNLGFAAANNEAYRRCRGDYLLLLNPDTVVQGSAIQDMLMYLKSDLDVGIVACKVLNPDGSPQHTVRMFPTVLRNIAEILGRSTYVAGRFYEAKTARDIQDVIGACLMLRREALAGKDVFDERFFLYAEDKDLCWRVQRAGWRIVFIPWPEIIHYGGQSANPSSAESFIQLQKSQLLFYRKHYPAPYAFLLAFTWWCVIFSRYVVLLAKTRLFPSRKEELGDKALLFREASGWLAKHLWHRRLTAE